MLNLHAAKQQWKLKNFIWIKVLMFVRYNRYGKCRWVVRGCVIGDVTCHCLSIIASYKLVAVGEVVWVKKENGGRLIGPVIAHGCNLAV